MGSVDAGTRHHTIEDMLAGILERLRVVDDALERSHEGNLEAIDEARRAVGDIARMIAERLTIDGEVIAVEDDHEAYAIEAVTAYLDGAQRGDGYELLAETVASGVLQAGGDLSWAAGVISALARLSGDLAVLSSARHGEYDWDDAMRIIQQLAQRG